MKNNFKRLLFVLILLISTTTFSFATKTYLSGFYKIGNTPGARHATIQQAITELINDSTEVIGRVTYDIYPGVYEERLVLKPFNGASPKNFVIFRSYTGKAKDVEIRSPGGNTATDHSVIQSQGASFITFQDLTIHNTLKILDGGDFASCVWITQSRDTKKPSEYINIKRCVLILDTSFTVSNGVSWGIVTLDINNVGAADNNSANFCLFENNTFYGGFWGIRLLGSSISVNSAGKGNKIIGNKFYKVFRPISSNYMDVPQVTGNYMEIRKDYMISDAPAGIWMENMKGNFNITNNVIKDFGSFGIFLRDVNGGIRSYIYNNAIGGFARPGFARGIHLENSKNIQIYFNSINLTAPSGMNNAGLYIMNSTDRPVTKIAVKNNIFASTRATDGAYSVYIESSGSLDSMNYNDFYTTGANLAYINGANKTTLLALKGATPGKNQQSFNVNPNFLSATNLKTRNDALIRKANPLPFVVNDFESQPRDPETPDIGADEVVKSFVDVEVFGLDKNFVPKEGDNYLPVVIKNDGLISLKDTVVRLQYSVNGAAWSPAETFTLSSALSVPYSKQTFILQNVWNIPLPQPYTLRLRLEPPPVKNDTNQQNDTAYLPICVGLSGIYTVGGTAGPRNYADLAAVASSAFQCGCGAATTFNIRTGTYNNVRFSVPNLKGTSATNTITFQAESGVAADVVLTNATGTTVDNHHIVRAEGVDYAIFKNLTVKNLATSPNASGFHITNESNNVTIENCVIEVPNAAATEKRYGILAGSKNLLTVDSAGNNGDNLTVRNCSIKGGRAGIQYLGLFADRSNGLTIEGNQIDSAHFAGIITKDVNITSISKNGINMKTASDNLSIGIKMNGSKSNGVISGNRIYKASAKGIELSLVEGIEYLLMSNNMIAGGFKTTGDGAGIALSEVNKLNIYNNSVLYDKAPAIMPTLSSALYISSAANLNLRNNIFYNPAGGYAVYSAATTAFRTSDYNVYYTDNNPAAGLFAFWNGDRPALNNLRAAMGNSFEIHTKEINPNFVSPTDLHTVNPALDNTGEFSTMVPVDYDNQPRNPIGCDIGADEYINVAVDMALIDIQPIVFSSGPNNIEVTISNQGANGLSTPVMMSYNAGSGWSTPEMFTPTSLGTSYGTQVFTFPTPFNATAGSTYNFKVRINSPYPGDAVAGNDSIIKVICTGLKEGTYTIDPSGTGPDNFTSFSAAANALTCGITGPVLFNVAPNTYNERFTISNPKNTSEINTITFKGIGAPGSVIINHNGDQLDDINQNVIRLNRVKYLTLDNLKIINKDDFILGTAGIQMTSGCQFIDIKNCIIEMNDTVDAPSSAYGIVTSDSANILIGGLGASNCTFANNKIIGGTIGIQVNGISQFNRNLNINFVEDTILNASAAAINTVNADVRKVEGNKVVMRSSSSSSDGIKISISRDDLSMSKNVIYNATTNGITLNDVLPLNKSTLVNNMIGGGFKATAGTALNLDKVYDANLYYNSFYFDGDNQNSVTLKIDAESKRIRMLNNAIYNKYKGLALSIEDISVIDTSENNNIANKGTSVAKVAGVEYANLDEYVTGSGKDESSISSDPDYFTSTDLRTSSVFMDQAATPIAGITTDIQGDERDKLFPDIGADEYFIAGDVALEIILTPEEPPTVYPDSIPVTVTIHNVGNSKISGLSIRYTYSQNGVGIDSVDEIVLTPLLPNDILDYTFVKTLMPTLTGVYDLKIQAFLPDDDSLENDIVLGTFFSSASDIVDGKMESIISPTTTVTDRTAVTVLIKNQGTVPISNFTVNYKIDGEGLVSEPFVETIEPNASTTFTFSDSIDCAKILRNFKVYIDDLQNDISLLNDSAKRVIFNDPACGQIDPGGIKGGDINFVISDPWPNPATDEMNLDLDLPESGDVKVIVRDVLGKELLEENLGRLAQGTQTIKINLNHIASGVYHTSVIYKDQVKTYRLVITQ